MLSGTIPELVHHGHHAAATLTELGNQEAISKAADYDII